MCLITSTFQLAGKLLKEWLLRIPHDHNDMCPLTPNSVVVIFAPEAISEEAYPLSYTPMGLVGELDFRHLLMFTLTFTTLTRPSSMVYASMTRLKVIFHFLHWA